MGEKKNSKLHEKNTKHCGLTEQSKWPCGDGDRVCLGMREPVVRKRLGEDEGGTCVWMETGRETVPERLRVHQFKQGDKYVNTSTSLVHSKDVTEYEHVTQNEQMM